MDNHCDMCHAVSGYTPHQTNKTILQRSLAYFEEFEIPWWININYWYFKEKSARHWKDELKDPLADGIVRMNLLFRRSELQGLLEIANYQ